jgi:group I intron endonuclease
MAFGILYGMRHSGVYKIVNISNGKCYVGSSVQIESRIFKHLAFLRRGDHPNGHLQAAFSKYKEHCFDFEVLERCERADLLAREQHYLDALAPQYNICKVAGNTLGYKHERATKIKMSAANKGNQRMLGKEHSEETKRRIGDLAAQRTHTPDAKMKISQSLVGNARTLGHKLSEPHKALVKAASLKMWNGSDAAARKAAAAKRSADRWADPLWKQMQSEKIRIGKANSKNV